MNFTLTLPDTEKIEQEAQWDGLHGVITNIPDMDASAIIAQYKGLWLVEETFRLTKHDLRVRSVYHWTRRRNKKPRRKQQGI